MQEDSGRDRSPLRDRDSQSEQSIESAGRNGSTQSQALNPPSSTERNATNGQRPLQDVSNNIHRTRMSYAERMNFMRGNSQLSNIRGSCSILLATKFLRTYYLSELVTLKLLSRCSRTAWSNKSPHGW